MTSPNFKMKYPPNRIREFRLRARLSQRELAKLIGIDNTTLSRHETSAYAIEPVYIRRYAAVFKIDSYELFLQPDPSQNR